MEKCYLCPRNCGVDRGAGELGYCRSGAEPSVAKYMLHRWEEPCICTGNGAGTVFFSGCNLRCVYCQNMKISRGEFGKKCSEEELAKIIFELIDAGAGSIEFVTPTHFSDSLAHLLQRIKGDICVPVVWNCGGYEKAESLLALEGLVDIFLPDLKYFSNELAARYSHAPGYHEYAMGAIEEMLRQTGAPSYDENGRLLKGVIVRHLVLPGQRQDSISLLGSLAERIGAENVVLSLMSQYTPDFYISSGCEPCHRELCRRVTSFEYNSVLARATELGFDGYFQEAGAADKSFTPEF